jgi:hypothetical protein
MEASMLTLKAEVNMFQWNEPKVRIPFSMKKRIFELALLVSACGG